MPREEVREHPDRSALPDAHARAHRARARAHRAAPVHVVAVRASVRGSIFFVARRELRRASPGGRVSSRTPRVSALVRRRARAGGGGVAASVPGTVPAAAAEAPLARRVLQLHLQLQRIRRRDSAELRRRRHRTLRGRRGFSRRRRRLERSLRRARRNRATRVHEMLRQLGRVAEVKPGVRRHDVTPRVPLHPTEASAEIVPRLESTHGGGDGDGTRASVVGPRPRDPLGPRPRDPLLRLGGESTTFRVVRRKPTRAGAAGRGG